MGIVDFLNLFDLYFLPNGDSNLLHDSLRCIVGIQNGRHFGRYLGFCVFNGIYRGLLTQTLTIFVFYMDYYF